MDFTELYEKVSELPEELRNILVIKLLADEKVSYDTISCGYVEYIQRLKNEQTKEYNELQECVHRIFVGAKKDRDKNISDAILFLWRKKRINLSKEQIVKIQKTYEED